MTVSPARRSLMMAIVLATTLFAAGAEAHELSAKQAKAGALKVARAQARAQARAPDTVVRGSGVASCQRRSLHRFRCVYYLRLAQTLVDGQGNAVRRPDGQIAYSQLRCRSFVRVSFRSSRSRRVRTQDIGDKFECDVEEGLPEPNRPSPTPPPIIGTGPPPEGEPG